MSDFENIEQVYDLLKELDGQNFNVILASTSIAGAGTVRLLLRTGAISRNVSYVVEATYENVDDPSAKVGEIFQSLSFHDGATSYFKAVNELNASRINELRAEKLAKA